jgi:hypothetical protein
MTCDKFMAAPFVGEDGLPNWGNYGGVWFDFGAHSDQYGWAEDSRGLTEDQAARIADELNAHPVAKMWTRIIDVDDSIIDEIADRIWEAK